MNSWLKQFTCWLTLGHIWERVGGVDDSLSVFSTLPVNQMYMCVLCLKCVQIDVKNQHLL